MTGNELRNKIKEAGFELKKISELLKISPQALNSKLNAASVKSDFAERINSIIKPSVYQHMDTEKPAIVSEPGAEIIPDAAMPGIYQDIIKALIKRSDDLAELAKAQIRITDAMLEERQMIRQTADAAVTLAKRAAAPQPSSLEKLESKMDLNFQHDEQVDLFLAMQIAALSGKSVHDLLDEMHNAMSNGPIELDTSMKAGKGKLSKA